MMNATELAYAMDSCGVIRLSPAGSSNKERPIRNYDEVAERLGFTPNEDGNWGVDLYAGELVWPELVPDKATPLTTMDDEDPMIRAINRAIETL
jgi:hypothetical protein